jgi:hypothetical protein
MAVFEGKGEKMGKRRGFGGEEGAAEHRTTGLRDDGTKVWLCAKEGRLNTFHRLLVEPSAGSAGNNRVTMKTNFPLMLAVGLFSTSLFAQDTSQKIVGTWLSFTTNASAAGGSNWINKETKYNADGTYTLTGEVGVVDPPPRPGVRTYVHRNGVLIPEEEDAHSKFISGSGTWRVEGGYLYTALTNSSSMRTNAEIRFEIISIDGERLVFRRSLRRQASVEFPPETAVRKR